MKNVISFLCMILFFTFNSCSQDRVITFDQLPANSQTTITKYFNKDNISFVKIDEEAFSYEYEIYFNDGTKVEFEKSGEVKKVDCNHQRVPDGLIPAPVLTYVKNNYPNAFIIEWNKKRNGWKAELNNELELYFNNQYQFIGIDD